MTTTEPRKGDRVTTPDGKIGTVVRVNVKTVNVKIDAPVPFHRNYLRGLLVEVVGGGR